MNIQASVGKDGKNLAADVKAVQKLLNAHHKSLRLPSKLKEDGICGSRTIEAILVFQKKVAKLSQPDGRVDPGGKTWKALNGVGGFLALPASTDYYSYKEAMHQFGTANTLKSIAKAAKAAKASLKLEIGIGHISLESGGAFGGHTSHQKGVDVDIRPLRSDGKHLPTNIDDDSYSSEKTKKLVEILRKDTNLELILFNDEDIEGVKFWSGHGDHLHVRFKS